MNRYTRHAFLRGALAILLLGAFDVKPVESAEPEEPVRVLRRPHISPDYSGVVIPPNIAPLDFVVREQGRRYRVTIQSAQGATIEIGSDTGEIRIPLRPWKQMLNANRGQSIRFDVLVQDKERNWRRFDSVTNTIAREDIDRYLVYRRIRPLFNFYANMGVYQRDLESFSERVVLQNKAFEHGCVNCHTFLHNRSERMALHIRSAKRGKPMLLVRNGEVTTVMKPAGYLSWHPSGRLLAFSTNKLSVFYHTVGESRDVYDAASDLGIYWIDSNTVVTPPCISRPDRMETWPAWSPNGRDLFFCSTRKLPLERWREIRYDLMRISYDLEGDNWGEAETVLAANDTGLSITEPRVSPNGRFLLFCMAKCGNFPVYQKSSDLYLMDLETRRYERLPINSDESDSWHSWSSNSRWIVFSSKRRDGLFARPHISQIDENGKAHKAFVLPQKDPRYYDACITTFNVPELVREPIPVTQRDLSKAIVSPARRLTPKTDSPNEHTDAQSVEVQAVRRRAQKY